MRGKLVWLVKLNDWRNLPPIAPARTLTRRPSTRLRRFGFYDAGSLPRQRIAIVFFCLSSCKGLPLRERSTFHANLDGKGWRRQPLVLRVAVRTTRPSRFACCCEDNVGFSACRKPGGDPTTSHPHVRLRPLVLRVAVRTTWASRLAAWCENDVRFGAAYRRQRGYAKADGQAYRWQRGYAKADGQPRKRLEPVTVKDDPTESRTHGA